jgi:hypothetical protein
LDAGACAGGVAWALAAIASAVMMIDMIVS